MAAPDREGLASPFTTYAPSCVAGPLDRQGRPLGVVLPSFKMPLFAREGPFAEFFEACFIFL
jgi:hypothetical protein